MKKVYVKQDVYLPILEEYGLKKVQSEKKCVYSGNGIEVNCDTLELKSTSKTDLVVFLNMVETNILEVK